jgi:protein gp37
MADMAWKPIGEVRPGDQVMAFDEHNPGGKGNERRWRVADVTAAWRTVQRAVRLAFTDGREVVTSAEHKWLRDRDRWRTTDQLRPGDRVRAVFTSASDPRDADYEAGYIAGVTLGDGTFRWSPEWRSDKLGYPQSYWRVAVLETDRVILDRLADYLVHAGIQVNVRPFAGGGQAAMAKVETRALANMPVIARLCDERDTDGWWAGWLAGMFDAEGNTSGGSLRISQKDIGVLETIVAAAARLGFLFKVEKFTNGTATARLVGDVAEQGRFLAATRPALARKGPGMIGRKVRTGYATVAAIAYGIDVEMVDITTTTGTFIADGLLTHNCYARAIAQRFTSAFPAGFTPLFHTERLTAPANTVIPRKHVGDPAWLRVFVCSMADLYGRWVPQEWIEQVHAAELANPRWEYLHLTKFPARYVGLDVPAGAWLGTSVDEQPRVRLAEDAFRQLAGKGKIRWLSLEPLKADLRFTDLSMFDWVVIGAQTETRQPTGSVPGFAPPLEWVLRLTDQAREAGCRVHWKPNLRAVQGIGTVPWVDEYPIGAAA